MELPKLLPGKLSDLIIGYRSQVITGGQSGAQVFRLTQDGFPTYYLKTANITQDVSAEAQVLKWLSDKLPVPEIILHLLDDETEYLLTTEIPGSDASQLCNDKPTEEIVAQLAEGLRMIHSIRIDDCPFNRCVDVTINNEAYRRMEQGLADVEDFDSQRMGKSLSELYQQLLSTRPSSEDLVFTHGDYCLPNIIINDNTISGFIDWGRGGVADRYQDLALAARSLEYNTSRKLTQELFRMYGIDEIDWKKVEFYTLLDEFF